MDRPYLEAAPIAEGTSVRTRLVCAHSASSHMSICCAHVEVIASSLDTMKLHSGRYNSHDEHHTKLRSGKVVCRGDSIVCCVIWCEARAWSRLSAISFLREGVNTYARSAMALFLPQHGNASVYMGHGITVGSLCSLCPREVATLTCSP